MQDTYHKTVIPNLMLTCIITDVIPRFLMHVDLDETDIKKTTLLCRIPAQCHVSPPQCGERQMFRSESFSSSSLSVLQLISAL